MAAAQQAEKPKAAKSASKKTTSKKDKDRKDKPTKAKAKKGSKTVKDSCAVVELSDSPEHMLASATVAQIRKVHGDAIFQRASDLGSGKVPRIPTGIFKLDYALGGGFPVGKVSVVWGKKSSSKTTTYLKALANAQRMCANCWNFSPCRCKGYRPPMILFMDVEGTLDRRWAQRLGVDLDNLFVSAPEYQEQSMDMTEALLRKGFDIVVIDSIAFLAPAKEIVGSTMDDNPAVQARQLGKGIRKFIVALNTVANARGVAPTLLFTNQVRMQVGVMFGCFHAKTPVMFADGSQVPIHRVVKERMEGPVLSWDKDRGRIVARRIVNWYQNGVLAPGESWLTFRVAGAGGRRGAQGFTCTPNHLLVDGDGNEIRAGRVRPGMKLLSWYEERLTSVEREVVLGSLLGDGHITRWGSFCLTNGEQKAYLCWKKRLIRSYGFSLVSACGRDTWKTENSFELRQLRAQFYGTGDTLEGKDYRTIPLDVLREAGPLTLAVWYADDGTYRESHRSASISVKRLRDDHAVRVAAVLAERFPGTRYRQTQRAIVFPASTFTQFSEAVARYLPPDMAYKLLPEHREQATGELELPESVMRRRPIPVEVHSVRKSQKKHRSRVKYDLQIEGDCFYLVGGDGRGVVVHNSPEIQPGGLAPGFAAVTETKLRSAGYEMDEVLGRPLAGKFAFRVEKNKSFYPRIEGEFQLALMDTERYRVGDSIDVPEIVSMGEMVGLVKGRGSSWQVLDQKFGSKKALQAALETDVELGARVRDAVMHVLLQDDGL